MDPHIKVYSKACPLFVPLVEQGQYNSAKARAIVHSSLVEFHSIPIDSLILGCTHYPFLTSMISEVLGEQIHLINSAEETAFQITHVLSEEDIHAKVEAEPSFEFYCSGNKELFSSIAKQWLNRTVKVHQVEWGIVQQIV